MKKRVVGFALLATAVPGAASCSPAEQYGVSVINQDVVLPPPYLCPEIGEALDASWEGRLPALGSAVLSCAAKSNVLPRKSPEGSSVSLTLKTPGGTLTASASSEAPIDAPESFADATNEVHFTLRDGKHVGNQVLFRRNPETDQTEAYAVDDGEKLYTNTSNTYPPSAAISFADMYFPYYSSTDPADIACAQQVITGEARRVASTRQGFVPSIRVPEHLVKDCLA